MQFSILRSDLAAAIGDVQPAVNRGSAIPILSHILFEVQKDWLLLRGTDLEITVFHRIPCVTDVPGRFTLSGRVVSDLIRSLPADAKITFQIKDGATVHMTASRLSTKLLSLPHDEFPTSTLHKPTATFSMQSSDLEKLLDKTRFCMSADATRYYLNGVYIHTTDVDGQLHLRAVATDGHRLAMSACPLPVFDGELAGVIIPKKAVNELRRMAGDNPDCAVSVEISASTASFSFGASRIVTKLVDGTYPDYERIIPKNNSLAVRVPSSLFEDALDRVAAIGTRQDCRLQISAVGDGCVTLSTSSTEQGTAQEEFDVISIDKGFQDIAFQARYLSDVCAQVEGEMDLRTKSPSDPVLIQGVADPHTLFVVMPLR